MSNYILTANGQLYHVEASESELYHYGVPGMKWGKRKARPVSTGIRRGASQQTSSPASREAQAKARKSKAKKALAIGAAVAGTAVAAYGAYKLSKFVKNKRAQKAAMQWARETALINEQWARSAANASSSIINNPGVKSRTVYDASGQIVDRFVRG